jgi:hypothetical protein
MLGRRLLVLVAVLIGLAALAASVAPREAASPEDVGSAAPPPVSPAPQEASPAPGGGKGNPQGARTVADVPGEPPVQRVDARRPVRAIEVRVGQRVRLEVFNSEVSSVQVGADGPIEPIDPDSPARFDLLYSTPDRQEIRLYGPGLSDPRVIGALDVAPAS